LHENTSNSYGTRQNLFSLLGRKEFNSWNKGNELKTSVYMMDFCPECGTRLISKREDDVLQMVCPKCDYKKSGKTGSSVAPKKMKRSSRESITVIGKEHQIRTLPTTEKTCPKCGNNLVYYWQVQTRGGDEGSTLFFRCTKCDNTFREYT
jgi:DNA-directed RNA polymerase subunit M